MGKNGLISVSTIISQLDKPALKQWANALGLKGVSLNAYYSETAEAGKIAHQYILAQLGGPKPTTDYRPQSIIGEHVDRMLAKFRAWGEGHMFHADFVEATLESPLGFYGRPDWAGTLDGKRTVLDIKSADDVYIEYFLQISAYWDLLQANKWEPERAIILLVPRDRQNMPVTPVELPNDLVESGSLVFLELLQVYRSLAPLKKYFSARSAQKKNDTKEVA
jgi:hypothetical protein